MTCQDVAKHLGLSWDTVRDIEKRRLKRDFEKPPLKDVTHIRFSVDFIGGGCRGADSVSDFAEGRFGCSKVV